LKPTVLLRTDCAGASFGTLADFGIEIEFSKRRRIVSKVPRQRLLSRRRWLNGQKNRGILFDVPKRMVMEA
jgi:hypothetical protein